MNCRILIVDDEPAILRGLRRMLYELENEWEIRYAESGPDALAMLQEEPCDVIITDLKMPIMNGTELLRHVRECYPHTVCIILSGYSDKKELLKATKVAHQFLTKPISFACLQQAVERVLVLNDILCNKKVAKLVAKLPSLPVLPATYEKLMNIANSPEGSLRQVAELVSRDMGLTASVLKLVNSAFFGLPRHIDNPARAVNLLGMETIKALVTIEHFISSFNAGRYPKFNLEHLWTHSQKTAVFAKLICTLEGADQKTVDRAYNGGLLHDIGKLILAHTHHEAYSDILLTANKDNITIIDAELGRLHVSHAEIGAYLLGLWGFDTHLVRAVACHHAPSACDANLLVTAVHAANVLEHDLRVVNPEYAPHTLDWAYLEQTSLKDRYTFWREECNKLDDDQ